MATFCRYINKNFTVSFSFVEFLKRSTCLLAAFTLFHHLYSLLSSFMHCFIYRMNWCDVVVYYGLYDFPYYWSYVHWHFHKYTQDGWDVHIWCLNDLFNERESWCWRILEVIFHNSYVDDIWEWLCIVDINWLGID